MANTENIEAKLCAYVDGELDAVGRAEIEAHLVANPQHRSLMDELMKQRDLLASLPRERAPEDLFEAMQNQLERSVLLDGDAPQQHVAGTINRWPQYFAAAAVLVLAIGLAAVIYFVLPNQNQQSQYAVVNTGSPAPEAAGPTADAAASRPLDGSALARREVDGIEAKGGSGGARMAESAVAPAGIAATTPTVVATATPPVDVFSKQGAPVQLKASGDVAVISNIFADHQLNDALKNSPGVPDISMLVVVNAGNPSAANEQIKQYLGANSIKWEPVAEPMPAPLELAQSQVVMRSRLGDTHMKLKGGDVGAGAGGGGFGGSGTAPAPSGEARQELALDQSPSQGPAMKQMASSGVDPAKRDVAATDEKERTLAKDSDTDGRAAGVGVSVAERPQQRELDALSGQKEQANAASAPPLAPAAPASAAATPAPSQPNLAEAAKPTESPLAAAAPAPAPATLAAPSAPGIAPADQITLAAPTTAPSNEVQSQQQQQQRVPLDESVALQQQQQQSREYFDATAQPKVFIARGVTRQQLSELNSVIVSQNRVANYSRAGGTITPTTVPAAVAADLTLQQPTGGAYAMADKDAQQAQQPSRRKDEASKLAMPLGVSASASATPPATAPAEKGLPDLGKEQPVLNGATATGAATAPSTAPFVALAPTTMLATVSGALTTQPATDEERVDVVFLVQPDAPVETQEAAPNAAAIEPATTPATTTSTAPVATSPSSAPAAR